MFQADQRRHFSLTHLTPRPAAAARHTAHTSNQLPPPQTHPHPSLSLIQSRSTQLLPRATTPALHLMEPREPPFLSQFQSVRLRPVASTDLVLPSCREKGNTRHRTQNTPVWISCRRGRVCPSCRLEVHRSCVTVLVQRTTEGSSCAVLTTFVVAESHPHATASSLPNKLSRALKQNSPAGA